VFGGTKKTSAKTQGANSATKRSSPRPQTDELGGYHDTYKPVEGNLYNRTTTYFEHGGNKTVSRIVYVDPDDLIPGISRGSAPVAAAPKLGSVQRPVKKQKIIPIKESRKMDIFKRMEYEERGYTFQELPEPAPTKNFIDVRGIRREGGNKQWEQ
jgi:hypothetical protein